MSLVKCTVRDLLGQLTQRTISPEGFLIAPGAIARAGNIQEYRASELGFDVTHGMDSNQIVRLYRPTSEVHSPETIKSFEGKTLTMGHPFGGVDAERWKTVAIGDIRGVKADGDHLTGELVIRDAAAIKDIQSGKRQLSCGYTFDCDMTAGRTADGKAYDGTMTHIDGNHVAVVDMARGGPTCDIADEDRDLPATQRPNRQERHMPATRKIVIAKDIHLELEDSQATLVQRVDSDYKGAIQAAQDSANAATARATDAEAALKAEREASAKLVADHATALADLKSKIQTPEQIEAAAIARATAITDAQIEKLAAERSKVVGDASRLAPDVKTEGKTVAAIRLEVVTAIVADEDSPLKRVADAMLDGIAVDKAPADAIAIAFKAIAAAPVAETQTGNDYDSEVGRRLSGADEEKHTSGNGGAPALTGRALMMFRQTHGGRSPSEVAAQARR